MYKKYILKSIKASLKLIGIVLAVGIVIGILLEVAFPSSSEVNIVSKQDIYDNNYNQLMRVVLFGLLTVSLYSMGFILMFGKLIGQSIVIIVARYGMEALFKGFFPHAFVESASCILAAFIPVFVVKVIVELIIKKNNDKKAYGLLVMGLIVTLTACLMVGCCKAAAFLEYNISEKYWEETLVVMKGRIK